MLNHNMNSSPASVIRVRTPPSLAYQQAQKALTEVEVAFSKRACDVRQESALRDRIDQGYVRLKPFKPISFYSSFGMVLP